MWCDEDDMGRHTSPRRLCQVVLILAEPLGHSSLFAINVFSYFAWNICKEISHLGLWARVQYGETTVKGVNKLNLKIYYGPKISFHISGKLEMLCIMT